MSDCVFCLIAAGKAPANVVTDWPDAIAIVPLNPVVAGHILVIPRVHVEDFAADPIVSAVVMARAAEMISWQRHKSANLITSMGAAATQTVFHLHLHVVPRTEGDGLALPWHPGVPNAG